MRDFGGGQLPRVREERRSERQRRRNRCEPLDFARDKPLGALAVHLRAIALEAQHVVPVGLDVPRYWNRAFRSRHLIQKRRPLCAWEKPWPIEPWIQKRSASPSNNYRKVSRRLPRIDSVTPLC